MPDDGGELGLILQRLDEPGVHDHYSVWCREGVHLLVLHDVELEGNAAGVIPGKIPLVSRDEPFAEVARS
jgi:hypothetical protein